MSAWIPLSAADLVFLESQEFPDLPKTFISGMHRAHFGVSVSFESNMRRLTQFAHVLQQPPISLDKVELVEDMREYGVRTRRYLRIYAKGERGFRLSIKRVHALLGKRSKLGWRYVGHWELYAVGRRLGDRLEFAIMPWSTYPAYITCSAEEFRGQLIYAALTEGR